jgi:hypothetical protein
MGRIFADRVLSAITGEENGTCVNLRCVAIRSKVQPKATFYHLPTKSWICLGCAQKMNAQAARFGTKKEAFPAPEYVMELLKQ